MSLKITRKKDERAVGACTHNLADIPNGVTVSGADLIAGGILAAGSVIGADTAGLYHVIKTAKATAEVATNATSATVAKGHHFKVGDFCTSKSSGTGGKITAIDTTTSTTHDTLTLSQAIGAVANGGTIYQCKAAGASPDFPHTPRAVVLDSHPVESLGNHVVAAVTIGQFKEAQCAPLCAELKAALPAIVFI